MTVDVTYRDLVAEPIPHLRLEEYVHLDSGADVQQFLDADLVVIGAIPSQLKAWIDRIAVRGRTFAYSENGPVGLLKGKRIVIALARGNVYGEGSPRASYEHAETLLRTLFGFVGADVHFVIAEGLGRGEEARRTAIDAALEQGRQVSARLAA